MPLRKRYESEHLLVRRVCGSRVAHVVSENVGTCLQCERCVMVSDTVASDTGADAQCNGHCKGTRRLKKTRSRRTLRTVTQHSQGGQTWLCPPCSSSTATLCLFPATPRTSWRFYVLSEQQLLIEYVARQRAPDARAPSRGLVNAPAELVGWSRAAVTGEGLLWCGCQPHQRSPLPATALCFGG